MTHPIKDTTIEIMGKTYQIKCPEHELPALQRSAQYLEEKMRTMRDAGTVNADRLAVITALNVVHQLLDVEQQKNHYFQMITEKVEELYSRVEEALNEHADLELASVS